ncbi:MAG: YciK family oxidoreductase [Halieaceae bacterium]|jgi:NAD(P)-dependent dehydrogenase (short-subunit alcohol dehydrogenase family)|nr:YciK family oxidoreductase [Halieaceae bacterium]
MSCTPAGWQPASDALAGKTIMVTGAGDGIGRAAAVAYAAHGAEVLLVGRTEAKLEAVYDAIVAAGGVTPAIIPVDLARVDHDTLCQLANELGSSFSKLDGLLHNASILGDRKPLAQTRAALWHEVMQTNVNAAFMLTQVLMPLLEAAPAASVVFTSSGVGRRGRAYWGAYAVSKFATEGMMQVWADELGQTSNIRVNSLNPGAVNTAMRRTAYPAENPSSNPTPEALMANWIWLMSDASIGVNGEALSAQ